ncbi:hypothetical protein OIV83_000762 [Microbotryomycetes sp. JL201]|nr:hypothetical protein OIV83_000762 [Microbotryomycetes sp. JL201]
MPSTPMSRRRSSQARRLSIPSTPPETPVKEFFPPKSQQRAEATGLPISPPITPHRIDFGIKPSYIDDQQEVLAAYAGPPPMGRRLSHAFAPPASHRRAPTATLIRVAVATHAGRIGRTRIMVIVMIIFSAGYLASILSIPSPLSLVRSSRSNFSAVPKPAVVAANAEVADFEADLMTGAIKPNAAAGHNIGDRNERQAWGKNFAYRVPPQAQAVKPQLADHDIADSYEIVAQAMRLQAQKLENEGWGKARRRRPTIAKDARKAFRPSREDEIKRIIVGDEDMDEGDVPSVGDDKTFEEIVGRGTESERKVAEAVGVRSGPPQRRPFGKAAAFDNHGKVKQAAAAAKAAQAHDHHAKQEPGKSYGNPKPDVAKKIKKISKVSEAKKANAKIGVAPIDSSDIGDETDAADVVIHKAASGGKRKPMAKPGHRLSAEDSEGAKPKDIDVTRGRLQRAKAGRERLDDAPELEQPPRMDENVEDDVTLGDE